MRRLFFLIFSALIVVFACHSSKKTTHSKPKTSKPKTTKPAKTTSTTSTPKPAEIPAKNPAKELVFIESETLSPVLEAAQTAKKPVFISFYADWCAPCKVIEQEVYTARPTFTYLNKNFINFEVDFASETGKRIASIYEVTTLPTILFVDPQGVLLERKTGGITHTSITSLGDAALKAFKK
jgi:thiol:disulfide interchange protein